MNNSCDYHGVKELNKALMSRFAVLKVDFPSPATEAKILVERTGIDLGVATKLVKFAVQIRASYLKDGGLQYVLSTRDLIMWAATYAVYKKYIISAEMAILNKVGADDFQAIKDTLALHFAELDKEEKSNEQEQQSTTNTPDTSSPF